MPEPGVLRRVEGVAVVSAGRSLLYRYEVGDLGVRNLAIVALTDAGRRIDEVAAVFGLTATYVSMLRGRAARQGSAGLARRRGRPARLDGRRRARAVRWAGQGRSQEWIAEQFGVARSVIGRVLAQAGPVAVQDELETEDAVTDEAGREGTTQEEEPAGQGAAERAGQSAEEPVAAGEGSARVTTGTLRCRYAGAMLLHSYLGRVGAEQVFATLTGAPARRYEDLAVLSAATLAFALGAGTIEQTKHRRRADAGAAVGISAPPELKTLRGRLAALADGTDPLALQRAFAAQMLAADPAGDAVYFVDDHFVPYAGARPVATGWNTKRRHAQPGRDDTLVVDARGRAVVFDSGEPTGPTRTLPGVLAQLRTVIGPDAPVLLGFDRGGAYPATFTACRQAGAHWITYRRAPLAAASAEPKRSWTVRDGRRVSMVLADETVQLDGYGPARQLTLFEAGAPVLQVLTSETRATGADLVCWLRARWRIENMFKYASAHTGIDALACYDMDIGPDTRTVANPVRAAARKQVSAAQGELVAAERALPQLLGGEGTPRQKNAALPAAHDRIARAQAALAQAKNALKPIPAKIAATEPDPGATQACPHLARRGLQMVLRLLAFNAEAWLAEHLNAYLTDPDEYQATTRHLLHQGGNVDHTPQTITVTLDRPDWASPRSVEASPLREMSGDDDEAVSEVR